MAPLLGKRKRRDEILEEPSDTEDIHQGEYADKLAARLRQHFETTFEPLEGFSDVTRSKVANAELPDLDTGSDIEWDGCSDGEQKAVQVVDHSLRTEIQKEDLLTFNVRPMNS